MHIHKLIVDDTKIEIHGIQDGAPVMIRRFERDEDLNHTLQRLKPLLLDKCELSDDGDNPVQVTQLLIGKNKKGLFCRLVGTRGLKRGRLKLKTPRLSFKKHLSPIQIHHINAAIKAVRAWVTEQQQGDRDANAVTLSLLKQQETLFLESV